IVAWACLRIHLRYRIAGAPDGETGRRIVGAGLPDAAAAGLPGICLVLPGFAARLARLGYHIPAPQLVAGLGVERREPAAGEPVAGAVGDDDLALDNERRGEELLPAAELVRSEERR